MISCKEASELSVKKQSGRISLHQRFQLFLHNRACAICKSFEVQISWLSKVARKLVSNESFTESEKAALKEQLNSVQNAGEH